MKVELTYNPFDWHSWFAWFPVIVPGPREGTEGFIWLETIDRRRKIVGRKESWEYCVNW